MSKRTLLGLIVLLVILVIVVWATRRNSNTEVATPVLSVTAFNQSKNRDAASVAASPGDVVIYSLTAENQTDNVISGYVMEANIADVTGKSTLIDAQGASYNSATNSLVWTPLDIPADGSIEKQFSVRVNPLPVGSTNPVMKIKFNNELDLAIIPPQQVAGTTTNGASSTNYKAPVTGPSALLVWILALSVTAIFVGLRKYRFNKV